MPEAAMSQTTRTILTTSLCLVLTASLAGCGKADKTALKAASYAYDVAVSFTPAAVAGLQKAGVGAVVDAGYFGTPSAAFTDKANEAGEIELGQDVAAIDAKDQSVHLTGKGIVVDSLKAIAGTPSVEVRVYSDTSKANVLGCTVFRDTLTAAEAKPVAIACDVAKAGGTAKGKKRK
jgi:hypothetical protein